MLCSIFVGFAIRWQFSLIFLQWCPRPPTTTSERSKASFHTIALLNMKRLATATIPSIGTAKFRRLRQFQKPARSRNWTTVLNIFVRMSLISTVLLHSSRGCKCQSDRTSWLVSLLRCQYYYSQGSLTTVPAVTTGSWRQIICKEVGS